MILVVTGLMASGKSTVAQLLAESLPRTAHVRGDVFRRMVVSGREEMSPNPSPEASAQLRLRYRLAASTTDAYFEEGFDVIVQDVILGRHLREFVAMIRGRPLFVVALCPRVEVVEEREARRKKKGYGERWTMEAMDHSLRHETPGVDFWIDSSRQTPEDTAREILGKTTREKG